MKVLFRLMFPRPLLVLTLSLWLGGTVANAETNIRFRVAEVGEELRDDIVNASLLATARSDGTTEPQDLLAAAQADYARILGALYSRARYGGVVTISVDGREAASIPLLSPPSTIRNITVRVSPGPLYRFATAEVAPSPRGFTPPETFRQGEPATTGAIRDSAEAVIDAWRAEGHAKAQIDRQQITARHRQNTLSARLAVNPGPRLRFGTVSIAGNEDVRARRIRTIAGLEEGPVYNPEELARATQRLRRTGSFSSVTIDEAEDIGPNNTLPLSINVVEATPRRFGVGAEYSTVDGVRLSGFWLHRNFLGGAERFRVDGAIAGLGGETGGTDYSFGARYERPATPRADIDLYAELQFEMLDEVDFRSDTIEFSLGFTRYATDELTVDFGIGYLYSDTRDAFGDETFSLITLPLGAVLDRRDDTLNPTAGYFADLEITPFVGISDSPSGGRIKLDSRAYRSTENLTFAGRLQLGALFGPSLEESPPFYRFFSGGGGTVRGQGYQSLALDVGGESVGGRSFLGLSGEVRGDITENIQLVGFADWGYIGAESFPDFTGDSHAGAGIGVRYNTGIGPIRLDVAVPVSGDTDSSSFYIYVGIGQAF